jgi:hypothetical protein
MCCIKHDEMGECSDCNIIFHFFPDVNDHFLTNITYLRKSDVRLSIIMYNINHGEIF